MSLEVRFTGAGGAPLPAGQPDRVTLEDLEADSLTELTGTDAAVSARVSVPAGRPMRLVAYARGASLSFATTALFDASGTVDLGTLDLSSHGLAYDPARSSTASYPIRR